MIQITAIANGMFQEKPRTQLKQIDLKPQAPVLQHSERGMESNGTSLEHEPAAA